jgi:TfoX/Sxy family transcriptional regulator of competence genes
MMGEYIIYFRGRIIGGIVGKNKNNQKEEFPNILQKR